MLHYWAIRQRDLRDLQARLAAYGLTSLGRSEPHVEATLLLVRSAICAMLGDTCQQPPLTGASVDNGPELLRHRTHCPGNGSAAATTMTSCICTTPAARNAGWC
jgi:pyruvate kinase